MKKVTIFSSIGEIQNNNFENDSAVDVYLLDFLRSYTTQNHKAFAIVCDNEKVSFVIIKQNCTCWIDSKRFFELIDI